MTLPKCFRAALLLSVFTASLNAQADGSSLSGTVTDRSGSVVVGTKVVLVAPENGLRRETVTSNSGTYQIPSLSSGIYQVTFSKDGFQSKEFRSVELEVGQPRTLDTSLAIGSVAESVEVTAAAETLNRASAEVGGLIEAEQIRALPVSGRNWASLMLLTPGAVNCGDGIDIQVAACGFRG
jgi:hypothetical protein